MSASESPRASEYHSASESRADRFARELADLKISDPAAGRPRLWQRLGAVLMVAGIAVGGLAYFISHRTTDSLTQGDALTIALFGVSLSVVGAAIFLRYSLTGFLRFWMARQSFEMNMLAERVFAGSLLTSADGALDKSGARARPAASSFTADKSR